jgi:hypothetical protein
MFDVGRVMGAEMLPGTETLAEIDPPITGAGADIAGIAGIAGIGMLGAAIVIVGAAIGMLGAT